ncbi:MAG: transglutaminase-like domain-containing protein, partial [Eubacterium sp.]|nr:transglutaminase-like domain-containing protein [Eubacterium sp.]
MGKPSKVLIFVAALAALVAAGAVIFNIFMTQRQGKTLDGYIDKTEERYAEQLKKEDEFIEDGAVIGEQYTIRSTKAISDAYIAGDPSKLSEEDKKTYDLAVKVIDSETKGCTTIYEKEKKIFDWICKNVKHDEGSSTRVLRNAENYPLDTPYGVLSGKYAVCVGYATTFRLLMNMLGCDCHIPHSESHSWDEVQLDDGEWYFVDIYSACNDSDINYQYFNMDDAAAADVTDTTCYSHLPSAKGKKYLYPVQIGKSVPDIYAIPKRIKEGIDKKEACVSMIFEKSLTEKESDLAGSIVSAISSHLDMSATETSRVNLAQCWYRNEKDDLILAVYITNSVYGESIDTSTPEAKKIKKLLDKL